MKLSRPDRLAALTGLLLCMLNACQSETAIVSMSGDPALSASRPIAVPSEASEAAPGEFDPQTVTREQWSFGGYRGQIIQTPHYVIHTTINSRWRLDSLPAFFESAIRYYRTAFGELPPPRRKLETYLFADRQQWQAKTAQMLPEQASMFMNLGRGGFTTGGTAVLYDIGRNDTYAIAAHEGWHQYTQNTFQNNLPVWLEEGIATYVEVLRLNRDGSTRFRPSRNYERWYTLREAARRGDLIPLRELLGGSPQDHLRESKTSLLVYYAQVWALTRFLVEGEDERYRENLQEVLIDAARGELARRLAGRGVIGRGERLVTTYFNGDLSEFERQYNTFVRRLISSNRR